MSQHSHHKVKISKWVDGVLNTVEEFFENFDDAVLFINGNQHHNAKIHNKDGEVIFNSNSSIEDPSTAASYA